MTRAVAGGRYEGALRDVIHAFKYEGRRSLAEPLARLMRDAGCDVLADCDCVVPVPLHPWRRLRRGFNQARDLAERLDRPVVDALWRTRATASQMSLDAASRHSNMRGAFSLAWICGAGRSPCGAGRSPCGAGRSPCGAGLYGPRVHDRVVVLVDDVRTTGATLDECARVLLRAGAREVRAVTIAAA